MVGGAARIDWAYPRGMRGAPTLPKAGAATKAAATPTPAESPAAPPEAAKEAKTGGRTPKVTPPSGGPSAATSLADSEEYLNLLWWGREGSGKTTDLATAANRGRTLVVNAEGGLKKKPLRDWGIDLNNIVPWPDRTRSELEINYDTMDQLLWQLKAELLADPGSWYAVGWDSGSELYDAFVADVRAAEVERNNRYPESSPKRKEFRENPFFTDRGDYGIATEQLRTLLRRYRDLPCHFLVTALERRDIDADTSEVVYGPAVGPAFQKSLLGYVDVVLAVKASELRVGPDPETDVVDVYRAQVHTTGRNRAKDRLKSLPRVMANPTFERILAYVNEELTEADDPVQKEYLEARAEHKRWTEGKAASTGGEDAEGDTAE